MNRTHRKQIALISVHGDPAVDIGGEEAGGQNVYVRHVGEALAELGWDVDMFTRQSDANNPRIIKHQDYCRTIRLTAGPETFIPRQEIFEHCDHFVEEFLKFAREEGREYSLIH
ncbi:MAG: glycosyltransferase, partial [Halothece sp. Uz-M2-17]|nr:glycosyltransferase [Halothece sp. Uz-M2-17]